MATSRSGAGAGGGGIIVTNRRRQRLAATPYERPLLRSTNWFSAVVVPSARAIASGAGKIFASIFSESSSSEDEDYASEDDIANDNFPEFPYNQENTVDENNAFSSKVVLYRQDPRLSVCRTETKKIIEQLIMKETFTSEECDWVIRVLNSRVIDWSPEAGEKCSVAGSPRNKLDCENADIFEKAVQDAKRWCQEKKAGMSSLIELPRGSSIPNLKTFNDVGTGGGSPVDVARYYMKTRSPWASSGINTDLKTPSGMSTKLFQEETLCSTGHYSVTSSQKRRSFASGSWNIQDELRRLHSKATEDMLCCSSSTKTDPSHSTIAQVRMGSPTPSAGEEVFALGRMTEPRPLMLHKPIDALVDAGASSLAALKRQVREASEALSSKPETSVSENIEVPEAVQFQADGKISASKIIHPSSPDHTEAPPSDMHKIRRSPEPEVTKTIERETANCLSSSQVSLWTGNQMENHPSYAKNIVNMEGNCKLLSEAYMEVPIVFKSNSTASGYREQYEDRAPAERRQLDRKTISYNRRRSRGRGK